jgi:nucleotide-binding universal stress UspA family protein
MSTTEMKNEIGMFSKILVAIDGSKQSMDAAYYAINVTNKFNAALYTIHVANDPLYLEMYSFGIYDIETPVHRRSYVEHTRQKVKEWFDEIKVKASEKNIQLSKAAPIVTAAPVETAIVDFAKENGIDLIVLGSKGYSGIKKLLLGSVASAVLTQAHCPVLIVR